MNEPLETYASRIDALDLRTPLKEWPATLLMRTSGPWSTWYAPFEHINVDARIVIVGITPGLQQAGNALHAYQSSRRAGDPHELALAKAKVFASFSGPMRANLVAMLDHIGVAALLGLESCAELFGARSDLAHFTSALRFPVTRDGKNYSGSPALLDHEYTRRELEAWFVPEMANLATALVVPLGPAVTDAVLAVATRALLDPARVLTGLPHPSGANAERIAYFLQRKSREKLSVKVDPAKLDAARHRLIEQIDALRPPGDR